MKKVTISDVAKKANVSKATVSRVLSGSKLISEETRNNVLKIISELNYVPNFVAQSLSNSSTKILGIVLNSEDIDPLLNNFFSEIISTISSYLLKNNYYTLYIHCENNEEEAEYIRFLVNSRRIDGLIFLRAYEQENIFEFLYEENVPFTVVGTPEKSNKYMWVDNDNIKASYDMTNKLIQKNNKRIAFVGGPRDLRVTGYRLEGFLRALNENGLTIKEEYLLETSFNENEAKETFKKFITENEVDAVFTTDDIFAIAVTRSLNELNLKNIDVTGFNNSYLRRFCKFNFMTVDINVHDLGVGACELLLDSIRGEVKYNHKIIETKIIE